VQGFVKETLNTKVMLPMHFSSVQRQNGHIFVIGGFASDNFLKTCYEIDGNMNMIERAPMSRGRMNCALNLISDRFIFGIGGFVGKGIASEYVECFDILTNSWNMMQPLNKARSGTTACSVGNRYIYVFPGT
jgi:hypothetical protein